MPAVYRYEVAPTARAQCQVQACKAKGDKIQKGELRFGSLVTIQEHDTWKWKHWGCVTPAQFSNIVDQIGGLDDLDLDKDLDILDGYDELPGWAQEKVKYALKNGHVHDEDWKGDPELNVPGAKGLHKRTPKKKAKEDDDATGEGGQDDSPEPKAKKGRGKKAEVVKKEDGEQPKKQKTTAKKRKADAVDDEDEKEQIDKDEKPPTKSRAKNAKATIKDEEVPVEPLEESTRKKPKSRKRNRFSKGDKSAPATEVDGPNDEPAEPKPIAERGRDSKRAKGEPTATGTHQNSTSSSGKQVEPEPKPSNTETEVATKATKSRGRKTAKEERAVGAESDEAAVEVPVAKKNTRRGPKPKTRAG